MSAPLQWLFGFHAVESALRNDPEHVERVLVEAGRQDRRMREIEPLLAAAGCRVEKLSARELSRQVGSGRHQGIACAYRAALVQDESILDQLLAEWPEGGEPPLLLVLDGVTDPHNLGACLRTADAVGVMAVVAPRDRAVGLTPTVRKVASGAAERLPFIQVTNLARTLGNLKQHGLWVVGTAGEGEQSLYQCQLGTEPLALVMGAEGTGLRRLTREHCDQLIHIPMFGQVESLNVSVATAVCLYEFRRQRLA